MAEDKKDVKTDKEQEFLKRFVEKLEEERSNTFQYDIQHGFQTHGKRLSPQTVIKLTGGDTAGVHKLSIQLERLVLDFAEKQSFEEQK